MDCKVRYLAEIMVLILVNLSLKQMLVSRSLLPKGSHRLGLDVIGSKENMKFLPNPTFPKIGISLVGRQGTFSVNPWQADVCKKLPFELFDC